METYQNHYDSQGKHALDDNLRLLNDIRTYLRISAANALREIASKIIDSKEKAIIYAKIDGGTSQTKLAEVTKVPQRTIADWCIAFADVGLASEPNEYFKSHRALFTLRELGIDVAKLKKGRPDSADVTEVKSPDLTPKQEILPTDDAKE